MSRLVPGSWPIQVVQNAGCVPQPLEDKAHLCKGPEGQSVSPHPLLGSGAYPDCVWHFSESQGVSRAGGFKRSWIWKISARSYTWPSVSACHQPHGLPWAILEREACNLGHLKSPPRKDAVHSLSPVALASGDARPVAMLCAQNIREGLPAAAVFPSGKVTQPGLFMVQPWG